MKAFFTGIKDMFLLSWRLWLAVGVFGQALLLFVMSRVNSDMFGAAPILIWLSFILGPLIPFIKYKEEIASKGISSLSLFISYIAAVFVFFLLFVVIYLYGFGFSQ